MATQSFDLTAGAWTDLGPTPCFLQLALVYPVRLVIDAAPPARLDAPALILSGAGDQSWCEIGLGGQRAYARAEAAANAVVVTR